MDPDLPGCNKNYRDEWKLDSKDAAHGISYHLGNGPGGHYNTLNYAWLHHGGLDSTGGPGLTIPAAADVVTLTLVHWYETVINGDGGQAVVDTTADGQDVFETLTPVGGYASGNIAGLGCNGLEGQPAFHFSSGGWVTSTFDLTVHRGKTVWLAFVFGANDRRRDDGEGWYIDQVRVEIQEPGMATCDIVRWPGSVPETATFDRVGSDIQASWSDACNIAEVPQTYSVQAGDLSLLQGGGQFTHAPIDGLCSHASPTTFTPGTGNEYYLVVPAAGGREGGGGVESSGITRPQGSNVCGELREESCP